MYVHTHFVSSLSYLAPPPRFHIRTYEHPHSWRYSCVIKKQDVYVHTSVWWRMHCIHVDMRHMYLCTYNLYHGKYTYVEKRTFMYMQVYVYIHTYHMHAYAHMRLCIYVHIIHVHTRACDKYVYIHTHAYTYMCVFPHMCISALCWVFMA